MSEATLTVKQELLLDYDKQIQELADSISSNQKTLDTLRKERTDIDGTPDSLVELIEKRRMSRTKPKVGDGTSKVDAIAQTLKATGKKHNSAEICKSAGITKADWKASKEDVDSHPNIKADNGKGQGKKYYWKD